MIAMTMTPAQSAEALAVLRRLTANLPVVVGTEPYDGPEPVQEYLSGRECDMAADRDFAERMGWNER